MQGGSEKPVGIGLVGAGAIMRLSHAPTIARSKDAKLVAVFDIDEAAPTALAGENGAKALRGARCPRSGRRTSTQSSSRPRTFFTARR